jgi:uncharacterized protein (DUF2236 family)
MLIQYIVLVIGCVLRNGIWPIKEACCRAGVFEFSSMATALHVPASRWPKDWTAFYVYWNDMLKQLKVSKEAKEVGSIVLDPTSGLLKWKWFHLWVYMKINGPISRVITAELIPDEVKEKFGLKSTKRTRAVFGLWKGSMELFWRPQPRWVKEGVKNYYMWDMRKRIKEGRKW